MCEIFLQESPNHQITKSSNYQITKSPNRQITKSSNYQITKSPNRQIVIIQKASKFLQRLYFPSFAAKKVLHF